MTFTQEQITQLLRPIAPQRVHQDGKGHSNVAQQDVRAHLTRMFGFGGWDTEILDEACVFETERTKPNGERTGRWDVCYRVRMRLIVKDPDGNEVARYDDGASETAENQKRGDAHGMAYRSTISQAIKRCAINLGDQFGLSLYNKGQLAPLVVGTMVGFERRDSSDVQENVPQSEGEIDPDTGEVLAEAQEVIPASPPQLPGTALRNDIAAIGRKLELTLDEIAELWKAKHGTQIRDTQDIKALTAFRAELLTRLNEVER
jgi:hypothetical protein